MAGRVAAGLVVADSDRVELERLTRSSTVPAGLALRARIVLLAAAGTPNQVIADKVQVSRPTVNKWRLRFAEQGLAGLADEPRPGPARQVDQRRVITETLTPPPARLGVTQWTSRLLAARLQTNHVTVAAAGKTYGGTT